MHSWESFQPPIESDTALKRETPDGTGVWLVRQNGEVRAFLDECAHMGNRLQLGKTTFVCPRHGWAYALDGSNLAADGPPLRQLKCRTGPGGSVQVLIPEREMRKNETKIGGRLEVDVLSHASLLLRYANERVLFDPWLTGTAYYGSWHLFPDARVSVEGIEPTAVVITHPHPDHFHEPSLARLAKSVPVYYPEFPSRIIQRGLTQLGFTDLRPQLWSQEFTIGESIHSSFLRPSSMWEDAAVLTHIRDADTDFLWLNQVDAGAPLEQALIARVDLLSSAFDQGASGYPLTWLNVSVARKERILREARKQGMLSLTDLAFRLRASHFLPFAGHWRLGMPEHQAYSQQIQHTTFADLEQAFAAGAPACSVLGIFPGESYDFQQERREMNVTVRSQVASGFESFSESEALKVRGWDGNLTELYERFGQFMAGLSAQSEAFGSENVVLTVTDSDGRFHDETHFVSKASAEWAQIRIDVAVPLFVIELLADGVGNWDHVGIGYWGEWSRKPDVYPANFMRLLQSGTVPELADGDVGVDWLTDGFLDRSVAELVEANVELVPPLLSRIGLPCVSCNRLNTDTLGTALRIHGIELAPSEWALRELAVLTDSPRRP